MSLDIEFQAFGTRANLWVRKDHSPLVAHFSDECAPGKRV
jgi:hypothetical protein